MLAKQSIGKSFMGALNYNLRKLYNPDEKKRADLLSTNFVSMKLQDIKKEVDLMKMLNPNLTRNTYHTSLNFSVDEKISNEKMLKVAEEYMKRMGFDDNLFFIFRHNDAGHPHCHILALRNRFDGSVVSDSNNYKRSEAIVRDLEIKYGLIPANGSSLAASKSPHKDELEMIIRSGKPSAKVILQEKVSDSLNRSTSLKDFIGNLEELGVYVLFNQASTGHVSGITYFMEDFKARGQALGNQFKWGQIIEQLDYEQNRDSKAISQANIRTREKFDTGERAGFKGFPENTGYAIDEREPLAGRAGLFPGNVVEKGGGGEEFGKDDRGSEKGTEENPAHSKVDIFPGSGTLDVFNGWFGDMGAGGDESDEMKRKKRRARGRGR